MAKIHYHSGAGDAGQDQTRPALKGAAGRHRPAGDSGAFQFGHALRQQPQSAIQAAVHRPLGAAVRPDL